jgi:hypothetical protein
MEKLKDWMLTQGWVVLLEFTLVAALAVTLAYWTWVALAPPATAAPAIGVEAEHQRPGAIVQRHLFGAAREGMAGGESSSGSTLRLKVLGVFARGEPGAGRAIVALDNGRPVTVSAGDGIVAGIVLQEVHPDHVLVLRAGVIERINLERRAATLEAKPGAARQAPK